LDDQLKVVDTKYRTKTNAYGEDIKVLQVAAKNIHPMLAAIKDLKVQKAN